MTGVGLLCVPPWRDTGSGYGMDKLFAKHAELAHLHLETQYVDGRWEWFVLDTRNHVRIGAGRVDSLEAAVAAAEDASGGKPNHWHTVSRDMELKPAR